MFWRYAKTYCLNKAISEETRDLDGCKHMFFKKYDRPLALNHNARGILGSSNHN
jgi:hypothetical protein